jgi:hypothetical protein
MDKGFPDKKSYLHMTLPQGVITTVKFGGRMGLPLPFRHKKGDILKVSWDDKKHDLYVEEISLDYVTGEFNIKGSLLEPWQEDPVAKKMKQYVKELDELTEWQRWRVKQLTGRKLKPATWDVFWRLKGSTIMAMIIDLDDNNDQRNVSWNYEGITPKAMVALDEMGMYV